MPSPAGAGQHGAASLVDGVLGSGVASVEAVPTAIESEPSAPGLAAGTALPAESRLPETTDPALRNPKPETVRLSPHGEARSPKPEARNPTEETLLHEGLAAIELGDEETAYARFVRATEVAPGSSRAWFWRAKTAPSLAEVIRSLERASAIDPTNEKVRASLAHAIDRLEREQARRRFAQPLSPEQATAGAGRGGLPSRTGRAGSHAGTDSLQPSAPPRRPSRPGPLAGAMRQIAGLAALGLATLWLAAALLPLARAVAAAPVATVPPEVARLSTTYVDAVAGRLAVVPTGGIGSALGSGGELADQAGLAIPFVLGFLFLFAASAVFQRDPSRRFWMSTLAVLQLGIGALSGSRDALALATGFAIAIALWLLLDRSPAGDHGPSEQVGFPIGALREADY